MFAAEITTDSSYHILVDRDENTLRERANNLFNDLGNAVLRIHFGRTESDDVAESIDLIREGQWYE